jgi:hypothetical protein
MSLRETGRSPVGPAVRVSSFVLVLAGRVA